MTTSVHLIAAARPNFMKIAPLWHALSADPAFRPVLVHTGQHYDAQMSDDIFADLRLPAPDHNLEIGSGSHAWQTGQVMIAYERLCMDEQPDWTIVVGDVNSTAACALVATKLHIPCVHLEAGLRSGDRRMPEEINRLATDAIVDVFWTPSPDADAHLLAEGKDPAAITRVGNIMMDSYELVRPAIAAAGRLEAFGLTPGGYAVVTLHRPSNVDEPAAFAQLVGALEKVQQRLPLVFPMHPRTRARADEFGLMQRMQAAGIRITDPLPYIPFMNLVSSAAIAITDSGGVQEETTYLGIPCLTLRENTERPITVTHGTNRLINAESLVASVESALASGRPARNPPEFWDGQTAGRCLADLKRRMELSN